MWCKTRVAILVAMLIALVSISQTVKADAPVYVGVYSGVNEQPPFDVGQSFTIGFRVNQQFSGTATATVKIDKSQCVVNDPTCHIWTYDSPISVESGKVYNVNPPGINTPGNYKASVLVILPPPGGAIAGYAEFQVVQVAGWSVTTTVAATPFDFTLGLSPASVTVKQGGTATFQIPISYSAPSYSGTAINIQVSGLGPGMNYQVIPSPPTLKVSTSSSTPPGRYPITLTGSAKGVKHQANALLVMKVVQAFDFSLTVSPAQRTITPGASTTSTVTVSSGTSKIVTLTVSGAPDGVSASLSPTSGTPRFQSILSITTTPSVAPGQYPLTITGTAGTTSHPTTFTLTIGQSPDFRIDVNPPSQTSNQGGTTTYQINVVSLNGFNSQVTLSVSGLPSGANGVFTVPSGTPNFASTLTVTLPANAPPGSFTLIVTGAGGGVNRAVNLVLNINPATQTSTQTWKRTSTQTPNPPGNDLMSMLQQNSLLILAAAILLVGAAFIASRRRKPNAPTQASQNPKTAAAYSQSCGINNPAGN